METVSSLQKDDVSSDLSNLKICTHCQTSKTSLWRNGPHGPKSLCNACGIRYRRKGMEALDLESNGDKDNKTQIGTDGNPCQRRLKVSKLGRSSAKGKKKRKKNKRSAKVDLGVTTVGCKKESVPTESQKYGDDVMRAAIQLLHLSRAGNI